MRSREEIQDEVSESNAEDSGKSTVAITVALLQLEVLLDIRDLQKEILLQTYEIDKTVERGYR